MNSLKTIITLGTQNSAHIHRAQSYGMFPLTYMVRTVIERFCLDKWRVQLSNGYSHRITTSIYGIKSKKYC